MRACETWRAEGRLSSPSEELIPALAKYKFGGNLDWKRATDLVFVKPAHEYEISDHIFLLWSPLVPQQGRAEHRVLMTLLYDAMIDQVLFFCQKLARRLLSQQEGSQGDEWYGEHAEPY